MSLQIRNHITKPSNKSPPVPNNFCTFTPSHTPQQEMWNSYPNDQGMPMDTYPSSSIPGYFDHQTWSVPQASYSIQNDHQGLSTTSGSYTDFGVANQLPVLTSPLPFEPSAPVPSHPSPPIESLVLFSAPHTPSSAGTLATPPTGASTLPSGSPRNAQQALHRDLSPTSRAQSSVRAAYRQQYNLFVRARNLPSETSTGQFIPQAIYKPHTNSDRKRYVEDATLSDPLYFEMENPSEFGISLYDALHSKTKRLVSRDMPVFEGRGPSVSIRLEWPGYRQWTRQIPTKDFRSPPGPITMAKLAKNVAKCVLRFIDENKDRPLEDGADIRWKVGLRPHEIKLEDVVLVSLHHVSLGSWQPQLRLRRPKPLYARC
ncbi:hypothetical protein CC1G_00967 [Coprinopsis cinerea okayama7|uniref:Uncharacterized protein n=1 Tax=Coprinopsis cinerea (strain Okayama-7 / 130 / ATCC MYA-4618 / FGSC 9003) TaxID=240176 RepID=A8N992_COPC7|nr:hypothetical protein CC1G_00967 [Coprinopsis cinerea okayama7\|eukprot:XP_001831420.2 hypothetical protein CC1G_00967 [Coprinopsis cinerea okayama7\